MFKLEVDSFNPADKRPMEISMHENKRPVKVKFQRYSPNRRARLGYYLDQLFKYGIAIPTLLFHIKEICT